MNDNQLIAEFMGYKVECNPSDIIELYSYRMEVNGVWEKQGELTSAHPKFGEDLEVNKKLAIQKLWDKQELTYHTSWDALMPVIKKIEGISSWSVKGQFFNLSEFLTRKQNVTRCFVTFSHSVVYKNVVQFINYYNRHHHEV